MEQCTNILLQHEERLRNKIFSNSFCSLDSLQTVFSEEWNDIVEDINMVLLDDNKVLIDIIIYVPSIIHLAKIQKKHFINRCMQKIIHPKKEISKCIITIEEAPTMLMLQNIITVIDSIIEIISKQKIITKHEEIIKMINSDRTPVVSYKRFESLAITYQRIISDAYANKDKDNANLIIRDAKNSLYGQGFEVVEFNGENIDEFDVKFEYDCHKIDIVSPSIRSRETGNIIIKGIIYHPVNK